MPVLIKPEPVALKCTETVVKLIKDDLTMLAVDAFVYYAREDLELGSGYGTAIQQRGGVSVKKELEAIGGVAIGESVITGAGMMAAKHIIHACGPKFHQPGLEKALYDCILSALKLADENGLRTVALPPMGVGFYGIPLDLSARTMLAAMREFAASAASVEEIIICVIDKRDFDAFKTVMESFH